MTATSPLANVIAGPQLRTVANLDGRKVVVVEPLRYIPVASRTTPIRYNAPDRIADVLRRQNGWWISAGDIAQLLDLTPSGVKVHVHTLCKRGVPVESGPWGTATYRIQETRA